ncbi:hypothetical protein CK203_011681 [Vitis vinifera]|uniref:Tetratricopeptide repeat protein 5 OB fold domain-containing protein n=1 Tax=Vitis vinifera TaxID=29760 RepID=A0A438JUN0_VITVI|nr:hypothetical protein CK203_011681 [Vitis vinifera]
MVFADTIWYAIQIKICYVLSVYGISNDAIKEGDQLTLLEPYYRHVDFSWKGKDVETVASTLSAPQLPSGRNIVKDKVKPLDNESMSLKWTILVPCGNLVAKGSAGEMGYSAFFKYNKKERVAK